MYHPLQVTPLQSLSPSSSSAPSLPTAVSASLSRPFTTDGKGPGSFSITVDILMFAHCEDRTGRVDPVRVSMIDLYACTAGIDRCLGKLKDLMQMRFDSLKQTSLELNRSLKVTARSLSFTITQQFNWFSSDVSFPCSDDAPPVLCGLSVWPDRRRRE